MKKGLPPFCSKLPRIYTYTHLRIYTSHERRLSHRSGFLVNLAEPDAYLLAHSSNLHRYPEQHIRNTHRALGVRDYYELRILLKFPQQYIETLVVCLIQGRINFF